MVFQMNKIVLPLAAFPMITMSHVLCVISMINNFLSDNIKVKSKKDKKNFKRKLRKQNIRKLLF